MAAATSRTDLVRAVSAHRGARVLAVALALVPLAGCAYLRDRGRDFTDIVDVKGGTGLVGLGVKARATEFFGSGIGTASPYDTTEKFGRRTLDDKGEFGGIVILTFDGELSPRPGPNAEISFFGVRLPNATATRGWTWFRFGGEVVLPGVRGGLFVNLGEFVDFLAGVVGLDPVGDDGVALWAPLEEEPPPAHEEAKPRTAPEETEQKAEK